MDLEKDVDVFLRARFTLILLVSLEEDRALAQLTCLCEKTGRSLFVWDHADFFSKAVGKAAEPQAARGPLAALEAIAKADGECLFVLKDFHQCWRNQPRVARKLRNVAQALKYSRKTIVVTAPVAELPDELKDDAVIYEVPPRSFDELSSILDHLAKTPGVRISLDDDSRARIVNLALGLSANQAQRVFSRAIVTDGVLDDRDIDDIAKEKREIIRGSGALEYYVAAETIDDVGGLEMLKHWLRIREVAFRDEARADGLPTPKGIALIGIPGTGKSLTAKIVAGLWHLPLIRMDVGALFGGLVGERSQTPGAPCSSPRPWHRACCGSTSWRRHCRWVKAMAAPACACSASY